MLDLRRTCLLPGAVAILAMAVAGCANRVSPDVVQSASYQSGYADGCATGNRRATKFDRKVNRDELKFDKNENYAIGWRQGYSACGGSQEQYSDRDVEFLSTDRFDQGPI
jgi:hypothetical protein